MKTCTFFGHRDSSEGIKEELRQAIIMVIEKEGVTKFLSGLQGRFDGMVAQVLGKISKEYPIQYEVVLAYPPFPGRNEGFQGVPSFLPEGQEEGPLRFAIDRRNRWMVEHSDYVISYVYKPYGGAFKFSNMAEKKGKN